MQNMPQWKVTGVMMIFAHSRYQTAKTICSQRGIVKYIVDISCRACRQTDRVSQSAERNILT